MFLLAWTAWEAVRTRFLRVYIHRQGWTIRDADALLRCQQVSSMASAAGIMTTLGAQHPSQWRGLSGQTWRKLEEIQAIRHRLAHGFDTLNPALIQAAAECVLAAIKHRDWLEQHPIKSESGQPIVMGNLMARQASPKVDRLRTYGDLIARFTQPKSTQRKALPSTQAIRDITEKLRDTVNGGDRPSSPGLATLCTTSP